MCVFLTLNPAVGNQARYEDLAKCMNVCSRIAGEERPNTKFNRDYLRKWFMSRQEKSQIEKPYLSKVQKQERKRWCIREKRRLRRLGKRFHACFLNEKCFYTTSRQRKIKVLPPGPHENPEEVRPVVPTTVIRRNDIKVVYLDVVARPIAEHDFYGKVFLERIAREEKYKRTTTTERFCDNREGIAPTLPPPFSFHPRSRGRRRHSSGRGCPAIMVRVFKTPSKYNAKTGTLSCKYKANTGSQKTLP